MTELLKKAHELYEVDKANYPFKGALPTFNMLPMYYQLFYLDRAVSVAGLTPNPAFPANKIEYYWKTNE
jgi:hypothetical protein